MHICFIGEIATTKVKTGGIGSFVANIIPELLKIGCTISVISFCRQQKPLEIEQCNGYRIYWINSHQWGKLRVVKKISDTNSIIKSIHREHAIDIIETPENGLFMINKIPGIQYAIRLNGGHLFFAQHTADTHFNKKTAFVEKLSLRKADAMIGVSKFVLEVTLRNYPWLSKLPTAVIPNPITTERFYEADRTKIIPLSLLFFGSLTEKKGIRQLIQAMPIITATCPGAVLHIVGRDVPMRPSGQSFKQVLQNLVSSLQLTNVHFVEEVTNLEMPSIIEKSEIVVLPSHMEAMPLAWLEAMAMGKPFIGSIAGPGPEVIVPYKNGLLCDPFLPADIADKVLYMLSHKTEAENMGKEARKTVLENYSASKVAMDTKEFYVRIEAKNQ